MTRIVIATAENLRREIPALRRADPVSFAFAHSIMGATTYAATVAAGDFPILVFHFHEVDAVRILAHEENHRALLSIGEVDGARALDHPDVHRILDGRLSRERPGVYRLMYSVHRALRGGASPKTEAR